MGGGLTDYVTAQVRDCFLGGRAIEPPPVVYVGVSLAPWNHAGLVVEPRHDPRYGRVAVVNDLASWPSASLGVKTNAEAILFRPPSVDWGLIRSVFVADAPVGGNVLMGSDLRVPSRIDPGVDVPVIAAGSLVWAC